MRKKLGFSLLQHEVIKTPKKLQEAEEFGSLYFDSLKKQILTSIGLSELLFIECGLQKRGVHVQRPQYVI